ncbi:unnamed protein product [Staurois parvus]|uniref:Uncharacterized protein n=1 Tax=Staurois parvus TaxID=386267 RepID=A0ABN9CQX8_9NEOB|nr:unnamed protein product [Staurois parvus]
MLLPGPESLMGPCTASHCCCLHRHCQAPPNGISSGPRHGVSQGAESKSQSAFSPGPLMVGMDLVQD